MLAYLHNTASRSLLANLIQLFFLCVLITVFVIFHGFLCHYVLMLFGITNYTGSLSELSPHFHKCNSELENRPSHRRTDALVDY